MNTEPVQIGAEGLDTRQVVADLQAEVDRKLKAGVYADARIARAERANLFHLRHDDEFASFYLQCLREAITVDIADFEIRERRALGAPLLKRLKKTIWSLLKFYTYRLWSQQNQVNALLLTGLEAVEEKYRARVAKLEVRVAELERRQGPPPPPDAG